MVHIEVKDNGIGFRTELLDAINSGDMIASQKGTDNESGSGIGLQLVKNLKDMFIRMNENIGSLVVQFKDLSKIKGARIVKVLLEDQQPSIRNQIKSVPTIFIYKDNHVIGRWDGGISLKISISLSFSLKVQTSPWTFVNTSLSMW